MFNVKGIIVEEAQSVLGHTYPPGGIERKPF